MHLLLDELHWDGEGVVAGEPVDVLVHLSSNQGRRDPPKRLAVEDLRQVDGWQAATHHRAVVRVVEDQEGGLNILLNVNAEQLFQHLDHQGAPGQPGLGELGLKPPYLSNQLGIGDGQHLPQLRLWRGGGQQATSNSFSLADKNHFRVVVLEVASNEEVLTSLRKARVGSS